MLCFRATLTELGAYFTAIEIHTIYYKYKILTLFPVLHLHCSIPVFWKIIAFCSREILDFPCRKRD